MLSTRWRKIAREIWRNKTRTLLVVLSITVGVAAIGISTGAQTILERELPASYAATDPASGVLVTSIFDDDFVESVRRMPEVRDAEGRRSATVRIQTGPDEWRDLYLFALPDYDDIRMSKIKPVRGSWPPADREVLIERAALELTKAQVGDSVTVQTSDTKQRELRIVGVAHDPSRMPATFASLVYGYVNFDTLEWLGEPKEYNELWFTVAQNERDQQHIRRVAALIRDKVEKSGRLVFSTSIPIPGKPPLNDEVQAIVLLLSVFGFLSLILSGFLVVNTMSAVLAQQVRQIGMMKAIGARQYQLVGLYLGMALVYGMLATLLGVPLAIVGAQGLAVFLASFINTDVVNLSFPPAILIVEAVIGLLVPVLAALLPVLSGTRMTVREAVSDYGLDKGQFGHNPIDRALRRMPGLPLALRLALRNTFRRKRRLALTVATLTLASAIFVGVASVYASSTASMQDVFRYWQHDVELSFSRARRTDQVMRQALSVPGVVKAESWSLIHTSRVYADKSEGDIIWIYALPADTFSLNPKIIEGRWLVPDDTNALVISNKFLEKEPDVKVGDSIVLKIEGKEVTWNVVGVVHMMMADGPSVFVNYPYVAREAHIVGRADGMRILAERHDAAFQLQVAKNLEQQLRSAGLPIMSLLLIADIRTGIEAIFAVVIVLLLLMDILLIVVGALGLAGIMSLNILERHREIGVMRAIGASDRTVMLVVIVEGVAIGLISWALGSLLSIPLSKLLSDAVGSAIMQAPFDYTFSVEGMVVWLVLVTLITAGASAWPARHASRLTVRETLSYE